MFVATKYSAVGILHACVSRDIKLKFGSRRYVKAHMREHFETSGHCIGISFSDLSVWCFACESYIDSPVRNLSLCAPLM